jgi:uncharacterized FAD-dependent dehydrogenase
MILVKEKITNKLSEGLTNFDKAVISTASHNTTLACTESRDRNKGMKPEKEAIHAIQEWDK